MPAVDNATLLFTLMDLNAAWLVDAVLPNLHFLEDSDGQHDALCSSIHLTVICLCPDACNLMDQLFNLICSRILMAYLGNFYFFL